MLPDVKRYIWLGGGKYEKVTSLFEFKVILNQVFQFGAIFGCKNLAALFFETNELVWD